METLARAVRVSTERYFAGKASYYEVLEAQQQLFPPSLAWPAPGSTNAWPWPPSTRRLGAAESETASNAGAGQNF